MVGVFRVVDGIAHGAAGRLPGRARHVAEAVAGRRGEESDIDLEAAFLYGAGSSSVAPNDGGAVKKTIGDGFSHLTAHARGVEPGDDALPDRVGDAVMGVAQR